MSKSAVGVGLLGMGVVGGGVADALARKSDQLNRMVGLPVTLRGVLVRDLEKPRSADIPSRLLSTDADDILGDPSVDIVVEVIGGQHPALDFILKAVSLGKHIVTANKEVMARHGPDILTMARKKGVQVLFEASVAGGTPIISPLLRDLAANEVISIHAIINGTTNYILTRMARQGVDFGTALEEAQGLGYAEADPTNDVEGIDAAYKLAVLSTLAFRARVKDTDVHREGITRLTARDFRYAPRAGVRDQAPGDIQQPRWRGPGQGAPRHGPGRLDDWKGGRSAERGRGRDRPGWTGPVSPAGAPGRSPQPAPSWPT